MQSEQIDQLVAALAIAQGDISPAPKSAENPHFKSKFANLTSIWEACRTQLSAQGIAVIQTIDIQGDMLLLVTTLAHKSGQWIRSKAPIIAGEKKTPQTIGSAITYMRRYSLAAIVGVAPEDDDDGNAASIQQRGQHQRPRYEAPEEIDARHAPVSFEQAQRLEEIYNRCSPEHKASVLINLKKAPTFAEDFSQVPSGLYDRLINSAIKDIEKMSQAKKQEAC